MNRLADEIIEGRRLTEEEDLSILLKADLKELCKGADKIRKALCGHKADLCSIINGRSGRCSENCKFCAQSSHNSTDCEVYGFLEKDILLKECGHALQQGISRYSIVTAGRSMEGEDLEKAIEAYQSMHKAYPDMILCASHGLVKENDLKRLHEAGVTMYHTNVETSERFFPEICTTHTYADKLEEIRLDRKSVV